MNSIDEFNSGRCKRIDISIDTSIPKFIVKDDGSGIPIGKLTEILTTIHSGGKFDSDAYTFAAGLNGIGTTLTNALSKELRVTVSRDGKKAEQLYKYGRLIEEDISSYNGEVYYTGTKFEWIPDEEIFGDFTIPEQRYLDFVHVVSSINPGIEVHILFNKKSYIFHSTNGISDFLLSLLKKKKVSLVHESPISTRLIDDDMGIDLAFGFSSSIAEESIVSYVNGLPTRSHGGPCNWA